MPTTRKDSVIAWARFHQQVAGDWGGTVLEPGWLGASKPHRCLCAKGHECRPRPNDVQQGQGICRTCAGCDPTAAWANFRSAVELQGGLVLETQWLGALTPHRCICPHGHECKAYPAGVQQGRDMCRICAHRDSVTSWTDFQRNIAVLRGEVLELEWLGANRPHRCQCSEGHLCAPRPSCILRGQGMCLTCSRLNRVNPRSQPAWRLFRRQVAEQGAKVLELKWLGSGNPHRCLCARGHVCRPRPNRVRQGGSVCRTCVGQDSSASRSNFYQRVSDQGAVVLEQRWLGANEPHRCLCAKGHECSPRPTSVQQGSGVCRICSWTAQNVLYLVRDVPKGRVKFGITNGDGRSRLRDHRRAGYAEVCCLATGLPEHLAALTEQKIKLALAMVDARPVRGTEYFSDEYLPLIENEIAQWIPGQIVPMVTLILAPKNSSPA
jgi:hypothetical protein